MNDDVGAVGKGLRAKQRPILLSCQRDLDPIPAKVVSEYRTLLGSPSAKAGS
jgi:hypothetical protein